MGMTIEEAIKRIDEHNYIHQRKEPRAIYISEALETAIEIMRKYQKIAELYDFWRSGKCEYTISCMENIGKVLRDENDD